MLGCASEVHALVLPQQLGQRALEAPHRVPAATKTQPSLSAVEGHRGPVTTAHYLRVHDAAMPVGGQVSHFRAMKVELTFTLCIGQETAGYDQGNNRV